MQKRLHVRLPLHWTPTVINIGDAIVTQLMLRTDLLPGEVVITIHMNLGWQFYPKCIVTDKSVLYHSLQECFQHANSDWRIVRDSVTVDLCADKLRFVVDIIGISGLAITKTRTQDPP